MAGERAFLAPISHQDKRRPVEGVSIGRVVHNLQLGVSQCFRLAFALHHKDLWSADQYDIITPSVCKEPIKAVLRQIEEKFKDALK